MKNILIPTDFSVESLSWTKSLLNQFKQERLNIVLIHVFLISDSILDLMLLSRRSKEYEYVSNEFWQACKHVEQRYHPQINSIQVKCFYGSTVAVFKNYLAANRIDLIVCPDDYRFKKLGKASFDPYQLIKKCGLEVVSLHVGKPEKRSEKFTWVKSVPLNLSLN